METEKKFIALVYGLTATEAGLEDTLTVITTLMDSFLGDIADRLNTDKAKVVKIFCSALLECQEHDKKEIENADDLN